MSGTEANSINAATTGIVGNTGTAFTGTAVTQHDLILGGATSSTFTNVAPNATSGIPVISQGASADAIFGTMVVGGGGTGVTSNTAYAVLTGGTTSTNPIQSIASVGTSPQLLTSNGAGALPTFQNAPTVKTFSINVQVFTTPGTATYTPTANMVYCIIECVSGGGGGGGTASAGAGIWSSAAAGGGGGYARKFASAATIGASQTVTVGDIGAFGAAGNNNGSRGGESAVGAICNATGGFGGTGSSGVANSVSLGGGTVNDGSGDFYVQGNVGGSSLIGTRPAQGAYGGSAVLGFGAQARVQAAAGNSATSTGGGGSGGASFNAGASSRGGGGQSGRVIITEFIYG